VQTTIWRLTDGSVDPQVADGLAWQPSTFEGEPVPGVEDVVLHESPNGTMLLIRMRAPGGYPMHAGQDFAFCQVVEGRGKVGLPDGRTVSFNGPELYIFEPGTTHDWHDLAEDTLLAICLVKSPS
jgi:quercetin dioxygenase-like cupin family protein